MVDPIGRVLTPEAAKDILRIICGWRQQGYESVPTHWHGQRDRVWGNDGQL
jgi:hypothetical protein